MADDNTTKKPGPGRVELTDDDLRAVSGGGLQGVPGLPEGMEGVCTLYCPKCKSPNIYVPANMKATCGTCGKVFTPEEAAPPPAVQLPADFATDNFAVM